jgi:hypothetical protein
MTAQSPVLLNASVRFPEVVLAKDQPQYQQLPVMISNSPEAIMTARFHLTWRERLQVLFGGNVWLQQLTFGSPFRPTKILTKEPPIEECL